MQIRCHWEVKHISPWDVDFTYWFPYKVCSMERGGKKSNSALEKSDKHYLSQVIKVLVAQSCLTLCDPVGCSSPGSSVHGISQARILEWVAIPFSRGSSWPRYQTLVSCIPGRFFYHLSYWGNPQVIKVNINNIKSPLICCDQNGTLNFVAFLPKSVYLTLWKTSDEV